MKFIGQKNKRDCGVAALAMLCNTSYTEANTAIPWRREGMLNGTTTKQLREGAKKLGYKTDSTPQARMKVIHVPKDWTGLNVGSEIWNLIPPNSLVKIPAAWGWHWVVWTGSEVFDPTWGVHEPDRYSRIVETIPTSYMQFIKIAEDPCPKCETELDAQWSGVKCPSCGYAFCY